MLEVTSAADEEIKKLWLMNTDRTKKNKQHLNNKIIKQHKVVRNLLYISSLSGALSNFDKSSSSGDFASVIKLEISLAIVSTSVFVTIYSVVDTGFNSRKFSIGRPSNCLRVESDLSQSCLNENARFI